MAWTTPRTWVAGEKPTAATMNLHIRDNLNFLKSGVALLDVVTSSVGPTSGTTELVIASKAVTLDGSTLVEVMFSFYNINKTTGADNFTVTLYDGASAGSGTQIAQWIPNGSSSTSTVIGSGNLRTVLTPAAGTRTYTARLARTSGSGTATLSAGATGPAVLSIRQVN